MQNVSRLRLRIYFVRDSLFGKAYQTQKDVPVPFLCEAKKLDGAGEEEDAEYEAGDEPENEDVTLLRSMVSP